MRHKLKLTLVVGVIVLYSAALTYAQSSNTYSLPWQVLGAGGGHASSATYTLDATIGQPLVGSSTGSASEMWAGFWVGVEGALREYLPLVLR